MQATTTTTYNGWTNYATWAVNLWMCNELESHVAWTDRAIECWQDATAEGPLTRLDVAALAFANAIKESHSVFTDQEPSVFTDLLNAALSEVNWHEIAKTWLDTLEEDGRLVA